MMDYAKFPLDNQICTMEIASCEYTFYNAIIQGAAHFFRLRKIAKERRRALKNYRNTLDIWRKICKSRMRFFNGESNKSTTRYGFNNNALRILFPCTHSFENDRGTSTGMENQKSNNDGSRLKNASIRNSPYTSVKLSRIISNR